VRLFFAFPLSDADKKNIRERIVPVQTVYPDLKWVKPENMHLTLHFLGNLDEGKADACMKLVEHPDIGDEGFDVAYEGFGRFPPKGIPRVFFIKLTGGLEECGEYHETLGKLLRPITSVERKPFIPHMTVARIKGKREVYPDVRKLTCPAGRIHIRSLVLFESVLQPGGGVYRKVAGKELKVKNI